MFFGTSQPEKKHNRKLMKQQQGWKRFPDPLLKGELHRFYTSKSVYRSYRVLLHVLKKTVFVAPDGAVQSLINSNDVT